MIKTCTTFSCSREKPSNLKRFASGATARTCAALCLMPVNVIKIRFEVIHRNLLNGFFFVLLLFYFSIWILFQSGKYHNYQTVPKAFRYIWSTEGVQGTQNLMELYVSKPVSSLISRNITTSLKLFISHNFNISLKHLC